MRRIRLLFNKLKELYTSGINKIEDNTNKDIIKILLALLVFWLIYYYTKSGLMALVFISFFTALLFKKINRVFFGMAIIFLLSGVVYTLLDYSYVADNFVIYAYYCLIAGVGSQLISHFFGDSPLEQIWISTQKKELVYYFFFTSIFFIAGFIFLNHKINTKFIKVDSIFSEMSAEKIVSDREEIKRMKNQLQDAVDVLHKISQSEVEKIQDRQNESHENIGLGIYNASGIIGAEFDLKREFEKNGFNVESLDTTVKQNSSVVRYNSKVRKEIPKIMDVLNSMGYINISIINDEQIKNDISITVGAE